MRPSRRIAGQIRQWALKSVATPGASSCNYVSLRGGVGTQVVEATFATDGGEEVVLRLTPRRLIWLLGISTPKEAAQLPWGQVNVPDRRMTAARKLAPAEVLAGPAVSSAFYDGFPSEQHPAMVPWGESALDMVALAVGEFGVQQVKPPSSEFCPPLNHTAEDYAEMNRTDLDPKYPILVDPAEDGMEWRIASHEFPDGGVVDLRYRIETDASDLDKQHGDMFLQNQLRRDSWRRTDSTSTNFYLRGESETEYQARFAKNWRLPG